jgi:uncharacterized protein with GYD domain
LKFISLCKLKVKPTSEVFKKTDERFEAHPEVKPLSFDYTLGRYDVILVTEAPDEKAVMKVLIEFKDVVESETLVAVPRDEIRKIL